MIEILVITYNVNNQKSAVLELFDYLKGINNEIILVSIQEYYDDVYNLIKSNYKEIALKYVYYKKMYGVHLLIISINSLSVEFFVFCLGPCYFGNKGFIIANINNSLIFTSLHLQHGETKKRERDRQFEYLDKIIENITCQIILAGDFNYRFVQKAQGYIENADEFKVIRDFYKYQENEITFQFTYKYNFRTIDTSRIPSYCDRIIFKNIKSSKYFSIEEFDKSDHKPVVGIFKLIKFREGEEKTEIVRHKMSIISCFIFDNLSIIIIVVILSLFIIFKTLLRDKF